MVRPKVIIVRVKDASGRKQELVFEDVVYMQVDEPLRDVVEKTLFMIDIDRNSTIKYNTGVDV